jgi:hypothetical protein
MAQVLFVASACIFLLLGVVHAVLTLRDLRRPRFFTPTDDSIRVAMLQGRLRLASQLSLWRAWLGFNLSHSLGLVVFGSTLSGVALHDFGVLSRHSGIAVGAVAVASLYAMLAIRFWFWLPAVASAAGAVGLLIAVILA